VPGPAVDEFQKRINQIKGPRWGSVLSSSFAASCPRYGEVLQIKQATSFLRPASVNVKTNIEMELRCS
jgi:hypothetical protein